MLTQNHPYHLVNTSPWPLTGATGGLFMTLGMIEWFHLNKNSLMLLGMMILILTMMQWWRDVIRESTFQGHHSFKVSKNMRWGMILFITSEVFFFISFFWAFFHSSLAPNIELGLMWPPQGIFPFNPMQIPLLNTIILLSSGVSITWAHHALIKNNQMQTILSLFITISLGLYFTTLQAYEYMEASFSIADSIYGSTFFMATGFHGIHVIIGTIFIIVSFMRQLFLHFSKSHHFGFEAAAWYWHFVDVVWLFLYISVYWWGN
uniref:Cytochrome c oxidase subunit 3 n=2 Tax=unclassified Prolachesilla TaxID=2635580 RepID=A0A8K1ZFK0_9NEOP|nr:cytochrome c oxidase subunit III [Prolachesilla sp. GRAspLA]UGS80300.1 cytochrome c oxidase subunit III [Prolachesilla sp. GRA2sp1LA]